MRKKRVPVPPSKQEIAALLQAKAEELLTAAAKMESDGKPYGDAIARACRSVADKYQERARRIVECL